MVADFLTKPRQGSAFKKFRDVIMGSLPMNEVRKILTHNTLMPQEGVGCKLYISMCLTHVSSNGTIYT